MKRKQCIWKKKHEIVFKDKGPTERIIYAKVEPRKGRRSKVSKSFGPNCIAYALESKPQIFKEAKLTPKSTNVKRN